MKFNRDYHMSVVGNFRAAFKRYEPTVTLNLTDEEIWDIHEDYGICEAEPHVYPEEHSRYDAAVIEMMKEANELKFKK